MFRICGTSALVVARHAADCSVTGPAPVQMKSDSLCDASQIGHTFWLLRSPSQTRLVEVHMCPPSKHLTYIPSIDHCFGIQSGIIHVVFGLLIYFRLHLWSALQPKERRIPGTYSYSNERQSCVSCMLYVRLSRTYDFMLERKQCHAQMDLNCYYFFTAVLFNLILTMEDFSTGSTRPNFLLLTSRLADEGRISVLPRVCSHSPQSQAQCDMQGGDGSDLEQKVMRSRNHTGQKLFHFLGLCSV